MRCRDLVSSAPSDWQRTLPPVLAAGPGEAPALIAALRDATDAPGRQAALFALGELGGDGAAEYLIEQVASDGAFAYEAALALGKLKATGAIEPLTAAAADAHRATTTRTAAACALLDLGATRQALPLLTAVLLAGTPDGRELGTAHGLPDKPRWALERNLGIAAVQRYAGGNDFGLDADSSWPRLRSGVDAFLDYVREREGIAPPT